MENNFWETKYLKYKRLNEQLNKQLCGQNGGNVNENKYMTYLKKIKDTMKKKGYVFWFDTDGKVLAQGLDTTSAKNKIIKQINADKSAWKNKIVTELVIEFDKDNLMNKTSGGLSISVDLNRVVIMGEKVSIQMKNKENSLFSLCYSYDELSKFKPSDLKKISLFVSNETLKKIGLNIFHYKDIVKYIEDL